MATASSAQGGDVPKVIRQCVNVYQTPSTAINLSRHKILDWINETLKKNYKRIEQLCDGLAYCQLMEIMFPGSVMVKKLQTEAKLENHYIHNLKLLQLALKKVNSDKTVPLDRLCKARFQDNLEFVQWFKMFWDVNYREDPNKSLEPRSASWGYGMNNLNVSRHSSGSPANSLYRNKSASILNTSRAGSTESVASVSSCSSRNSVSSCASKAASEPGHRHPKSSDKTSVVRPMSRTASETALSRQRSIQNRIAELTTRKSELIKHKEECENKRDIYYNQLLKIETLCMDMIDSGTLSNEAEETFVKSVLAIAYANEDVETGSN